MPWDRTKYPPDWQERRQRILERDGHKCKFCGVPNHVLVHRKGDKWRIVEGMEAEARCLDGDKITYIVLTIAHLDDGPKDCPDDRLAALCQKCHFGYDIKNHVSNAARTRRLRKEEAGQVGMFEEMGTSSV